MSRKWLAGAIIAFLAVVTGLLLLADVGDGTYALYRNSVVDDGMRLHVATFDAEEGERYNQENCAIAAQQMQAQQGVTTRFWCEKGRFRK